MATTKKTHSSARSSAAKTQKSSAQKSPAKKSAVTQKTAKKGIHASPTSSQKSSAVPEDAIASQALKWIDQAASLLRKGVNEGASQSVQARATTRKKAHSLLSKAHNSLGSALEKGTSVLQKVISKI